MFNWQPLIQLSGENSFVFCSHSLCSWEVVPCPIVSKDPPEHDLRVFRATDGAELGAFIWVSSNEVDETGADYTEWSKPEKKKKHTNTVY